MIGCPMQLVRRRCSSRTHRTTLHHRAPLPLVAIVIMTACVSLGTHPPVAADRPDFSEGTEHIAPGHWQVEAGATYAQEGDVTSVNVGELLTRVGLTPRLELRFVGNSVVHTRVGHGPWRWDREDALLGFKFGILDASEHPSWTPAFSIIVGSSLPSGTRDLQAPHAQPEVKLLAAWVIDKRVTLTSNVNYARAYTGTRSIDEYSTSASFGFTLTERVGAFAEMFAFAPRDGSGQLRKFANSGMSFRLSPDLQLDARIGAGPSTKTGDHFVGVGVVRRW